MTIQITAFAVAESLQHHKRPLAENVQESYRNSICRQSKLFKATPRPLDVIEVVAIQAGAVLSETVELLLNANDLAICEVFGKFVEGILVLPQVNEDDFPRRSPHYTVNGITLARAPSSEAGVCITWLGRVNVTT